MNLSPKQLNHFQTFGFLIFRQLLSPEESARYSREFDTGLDAWTENGRHDRKARHYASLMEKTTPFIASLADDPRFADVAEQLLETNVLGIAVDGNYMVGDTQWHPDTSTLDYKGVKFCSYPDPLDATNGALRVVPGSHVEPLHGRLKKESLETFGVPPDEVPAYVFASAPGDVIVFNVGLWHGSFGGGNHRRQGVVVFYEDPRTPPATAAVVETMKGNHDYYAQRGHCMYTEFWRSVDDPRHKRWIKRLDELGVLETPGFDSA
jgi:hypothetical protein